MARKRKSESGQVAVLATGAMLLIIGMAALVVDVGFLYATRRNMQTAADAAAIAGANALQASLTCSSSSCPAAQDVAKLNGFTDGGPNSTTVTVGPPTVTPNPSTGTYVQVTVAQTVPTFFMKAVGFPTVSLSTTAVAGFVDTPNCIVTLATSDNNALVISGGGSSLSAPNCNVVVDSSSTSGLVVSGGATLTASSVGVAPASESQANSNVTPPYVPNSPVVTDPLANLAAPPQCSSGGGCGGAACNQTGFTC